MSITYTSNTLQQVREEYNQEVKKVNEAMYELVTVALNKVAAIAHESVKFKFELSKELSLASIVDFSSKPVIAAKEDKIRTLNMLFEKLLKDDWVLYYVLVDSTQRQGKAYSKKTVKVTADLDEFSRHVLDPAKGIFKIGGWV